MATSLNKVRNPDFSEGRKDPLRWSFEADGDGVGWRRVAPDGGAMRSGGVVMESERRGGTGWWSQVITCKPDGRFRLDAVVRCDLEAGDESGGFAIAVQPLMDDKPCDEPRLTAAVHRASEPVTVRAYYHVPKDVRRLKLSVGLVHARGTVTVHEVRAMPTIEPEEASHPLAIPPPPWAVPPPIVVKNVCVCSETATSRPITGLLGLALGENRVSTLAPGDFRVDRVRADALIFPDATPPRAIRSLSSLLKLAQKRIVVISLPAFATLTRGAVIVRGVKQIDDPTAALVRYGGFMTRGFALNDTFTFAAIDERTGGYAQHHLRKSTALTQFLKRHGFEVMLESMCDQEVTSHRPVALFKPTDGGALFVLDIEPAEATGSTMNEAAPAVQLILNMLGRSETGLGQYAVPFEREGQLRETMREAVVRFREFVVHDENVPSDDVTQQLVTVGDEDAAFGLPLEPKPLILVRSVLTSGDAESFYGSLLWFKQLLRMPPYRCPYAEALASRFRLAWIPCAAPWDRREGWRRRGAPPHAPMELELDSAPLAALIDVVSVPLNRVRVVLPSSGPIYERAALWLPRLATAFGSAAAFAPTVDDGASFADRDAYAWRELRHDVEVAVDANEFHDRMYDHAIDAGAEVIRIEVPGGDADFAAMSIHRTDVTATVLEHVIGLQYGLIAVNRKSQPVHLDGFPPVAPGEVLIVGREDRALQPQAVQVG